MSSVGAAGSVQRAVAALVLLGNRPCTGSVSSVGAAGSVQRAVAALVLLGNRRTAVGLAERREVVHEVVDHLRVGELFEGAVEQHAQVGVRVATPALRVRQEEQLLRSLTLQRTEARARSLGRWTTGSVAH